jgi:hypothetical protein
LDIIRSIRKKGMYAVFSPRAVIKIKRKVKMAILLNIGADINVMIIKVADAANLPIFEITSLKAEIL